MTESNHPKQAWIEHQANPTPESIEELAKLNEISILGRSFILQEKPNGSSDLVALDGGEITETEWQVYCQRCAETTRRTGKLTDKMKAIESALNILEPLQNQVTPSVMAIRGAVAILKRA